MKSDFVASLIKSYFGAAVLRLSAGEICLLSGSLLLIQLIKVVVSIKSFSSELISEGFENSGSGFTSNFVILTPNFDCMLSSNESTESVGVSTYFACFASNDCDTETIETESPNLFIIIIFNGRVLNHKERTSRTHRKRGYPRHPSDLPG